MAHHHHFFKIVLEKAIQEGKLKIPSKFAREYRNALSSPVFLKVPTGAEWELELTKRDGKIWLEKGWDNFARHYSLKNGYFLVFRLEGNSHFHVLIFDKTASEIKYPNPNQNDEAVRIEESEEENSIQVIGEISPGRREKPQLQSDRPCKRTRANAGYQNPKSALVGNSTTVCNVRQLNSSEKAKVLKRADFKSNKSCFILVMQPTHIKRWLGFPADFARIHLKKRRGDVILCNSGKTWSAPYYSDSEGRVKLKWVTNFVQDNKLKVGDICAFELINPIEMSFQVFIDRGHEEAEFQGSPAFANVSCPGKRGAGTLQIAGAFKSANPGFNVKLTPSSVHKYTLSIPEEFARENFPKTITHADLTLCRNGKSWPAEFHQRSIAKSNPRISHGWMKFVQDNDLQVGDICVLEMTKENSTISFNVIVNKL